MDGVALRCYRATSWIRRATDTGSTMDLDGRFIFLWIAFNALYGQAKYRRPGGARTPEERDIEKFLSRAVRRDRDGRIVRELRGMRVSVEELVRDPLRRRLLAAVGRRRPPRLRPATGDGASP